MSLPDVPCSSFTVHAPVLQTTFSPRNPRTFYGRMIFRNQDLIIECADCFGYVTDNRLFKQIKPGKKKLCVLSHLQACMHMHTHTMQWQINSIIKYVGIWLWHFWLIKVYLISTHILCDLIFYLFYHWILFHLWTYYSLLIHSLIDRKLVLFFFSSSVWWLWTKLLMDIHVKFLYNINFQVTNVNIYTLDWRLHGSCVVNIIRKGPAVFQTGYTILQSHNQ